MDSRGCHAPPMVLNECTDLSLSIIEPQQIILLLHKTSFTQDSKIIFRFDQWTKFLKALHSVTKFGPEILADNRFYVVYIDTFKIKFSQPENVGLCVEIKDKVEISKVHLDREAILNIIRLSPLVGTLAKTFNQLVEANNWQDLNFLSQ